jgi:hypothetical protein
VRIPSSEANWSSNTQEVPDFIKNEVWFSCLQKSATDFCPESDESGPHTLTVFLKETFYFNPSTYAKVFQDASAVQNV